MTVYRNSFVYCAASDPFNPPAAPTDVFTLFGSPTSKVYIMKMGISTIQTTSGMNGWLLVKRSTRNTGGTPTSIAAIPYNSKNPASGASCIRYASNPTTGTYVGKVGSFFVTSPAPEQAEASGIIAGTDAAGVITGTFTQTSTPSSLGSSICEFSFLDQFGQPLTLNNEREGVSWNFAGAALPSGLTVRAYAVWYEQPNSIFST